MSTPIESNTEELREILQQVYDLPMAGGGSSGADLVITGMTQVDGTGDYFWWDNGSYNGGLFGTSQVTFDQEKVVSAHEKLRRGEEVKAVLVLPEVSLGSWNPLFSAVYPALRVAAGSEGFNLFAVRFDCASAFSTSGTETYKMLEYVFEVDTTNRTAFLAWVKQLSH